MADKPAIQERAATIATRSLIENDTGTPWFAEQQLDLADMCIACGYYDLALMLLEAAGRRKPSC